MEGIASTSHGRLRMCIPAYISEHEGGDDFARPRRDVVDMDLGGSRLAILLQSAAGGAWACAFALEWA